MTSPLIRNWYEGAILLVNIIVLALSARVNDFQEFFCTFSRYLQLNDYN